MIGVQRTLVRAVEFRIADSFIDSLARLTAQEQKAVKTTAFDLQLDPADPRLRFHRVEHSRDPNFWSVKVTLDLRIIVHRTGGGLLLCYAGHHDDAYRWAENRKIERHPTTGAAQVVEVRERLVEEIAPPQPARTDAPPLFATVPDSELLRYGVPEEWLPDVRAATEDTLLELVRHLPQEAAEALVELATGGVPEVAAAGAPGDDPFDHADARRRFRTLADARALERALEWPWEKWAIFLHPTQQKVVEGEYDGPVRIHGSAGTGKTVVCLHRAVHLARRHPEARVLVTTFWRTLADASAVMLDRLAGNEPDVRSRITARALGDVARDLYTGLFGPPQLASGALQRELLAGAIARAGDPDLAFAEVMDVWDGLVDAFQLRSWPDFRDAVQPGAGGPPDIARRERLWRVFEPVLAELDARGLVTSGGMFGRLTVHYAAAPSPFAFIVVDEAQDLGIADLRFLAALGRTRPDSLFFAGDLGQRIFRQPFSWAALGVDIRGRSYALPINYRTSHQIRRTADRLLPPVLRDADGFEEVRARTVSSFSGPPPEIVVAADVEAEIAAVAAWLRALAPAVRPEEIGVFVRSAEQLPRARRALEAAGLAAADLSETATPGPDRASVGPMHLAKGLEFKAVAVMACDRDVVPLRARIETVGAAADLDDVHATERQLFYVACTRARERLLISGVAPGSACLEELRP
jgi:hypothetical protein